MKIVYVCERSYNLYRTLLKAVNSNDVMDIVITDNTGGMELIYDELKKSGLFNNVYYFNYLKHKTFTHLLKEHYTFSIENVSDIKRIAISLYHMITGFFEYLKSQRKAKHITLPHGLDFDRYDEIHITDCTSILNFYLYHKQYPNLIYVEHAKDALRGHYPKISYFLAVLAKLRIIYGIRGSCRYIKAIEVNENKNLIKDTMGKEIREIPLKTLIDPLSLEQGEFIYQLYAKSYKLTFPNVSKIDFFLTTTLEGENESKMFLRVCTEVIRQYMSDADYIVIKPHPSDHTDYSEILEHYPNAVVLPSSFSAEIFALSTSLRIRKLINIDTSAVGAFKSVEKIITLGYEFVEKCKFRI